MRKGRTINGSQADIVIKGVTALAAVIGLLSSMAALSRTTRLRNAIDKDLGNVEKLASQGKTATLMIESIRFRMAEVAARTRYPPPVGVLGIALTVNAVALAYTVYTEYDSLPRQSIYYTVFGLIAVTMIFALTIEAYQRTRRWHYLAQSKQERSHAERILNSSMRLVSTATWWALLFIAYVPYSRIKVAESHPGFTRGVAYEALVVFSYAAPLIAAIVFCAWRIIRAGTWRSRRKLLKSKLRLARTMIRVSEKYEWKTLDPTERARWGAARVDLALKLRRAAAFEKRLANNPWARAPWGWWDWLDDARNPRVLGRLRRRLPSVSRYRSERMSVIELLERVRDFPHSAR